MYAILREQLKAGSIIDGYASTGWQWLHALHTGFAVCSRANIFP